MGKFIVMDTETNGLPKDYKASAEDVENWPRVIQIAYSVFDEAGNLIKMECKLIKPDGWRLMTVEEAYQDGLRRGKSEEDARADSTFWVDKGYSDEKLQTEGVPIIEAMEDFIAERLSAEYCIAHNISFDGKILRAEMVRAGLNGIKFTAKKVCTMMQSTKYCQIPALNGKKGIKWPTLTELHFKLFNDSFDGAHDAGADVDACSKCFFELVSRGVIILE
jgi:DNA polymerase-3 subunit epsilon